MPIRAFLQHHWPAITIAVTAAAIGCAALVMLGNMPPRRIVMATGPEGSSYAEDGKRYRSALAKAGVEVQLRATAGSVETAALLRDPRSGVSVGLMQGGVVGVMQGGGAAAANTAGLESLGTVAYEPLWWFRRREIQGVGAEGLRGRKIAIGPPGSGTRALSLELIKRNGMERQVGELLALSPREAAEKLKAGEIDVAFMMNPWDAPLVQQLLADERVALSGFPHADAVIALYPFLTKVIVPRGVTDLPRDQPPADVTLIATKTSLVVRQDLHPAIQYLLLNAASEIHSGPSIFNRANAFPAPEAIDMPLSSEAARFYKSGLPFLGVLYPMMRFLPALYDWAMRSKVLRMYGELRLLEAEMANARGGGGDMREVITRLDRLEEQANHLHVPLAYASELYMLRNHIDLVREGMRKQAEKPAE